MGPKPTEALSVCETLAGHGVRSRGADRPQSRATGLVSEALWGAIFGQKVTGREAARSLRALIRKWGDPAPGPQVGVTLFPDPDRLASLAYYDLHPLGLEQRRAETLLRAARWHRRIQETADLPSQQAREFLERLPGIGSWTSAKTVAVSHGDADAVAVGDFHLKNVAAWHLAGRPRAPTKKCWNCWNPSAHTEGECCDSWKKQATPQNSAPGCR